MLNYDDFASQTRSKKTILAQINSVGQAKLFNLVSGATYSRSVSNFVYKVIIDGNPLTESVALPLSSGSFYFEPSTNLLYVRLSDDSNPETHQCFIGYKHFFSNISANVPHDLSSGAIVHWDPRIKDTGELKLEIDFEQTGVAIESDSNIILENTDGFFDEIYDLLIWENQDVRIWSWSETLPYSEAKLIYRGKIKDKAFSTKEVKFNLRDQVKELRRKLDWPTFSSLDGEISESIDGKPKRVCFGKFQHLKTEGIDKVLDGYALTGLLSGSADENLLTGTVSALVGLPTLTGTGTLFTAELNPGDKIKVIGPFNEYSLEVLSITSDTSLTLTANAPASFSLYELRTLEILNNKITGVGTNFTDEVVPGDELKVTIDEVEYSFTVDSVTNDTELFITDEIERSFVSSPVINLPAIPYRRKNREWHIAGHKLREFITTITAINDNVNLELSSVGDMEDGDLITINSAPRIIDNISGNKIRINQSIPAGTLVGDSVTREPVTAVYSGSQRYVVDRDYTVTNTTEAKIVFNNLAEFNVAKTENPVIQFNFVNGNKEVQSVSSTIDLTTVFKSRDWIRSKDITLPTWYEIQYVTQTSVFLIEPWAEPTTSSLSQKKSPNYISDDSLITCDCLGLESGSTWIKNASQAVKWLVEQAGLTNINTASFTEASGKCDFTLSLAYPELGQQLPEIKEMISDINESVFGSLYLNNNFEFTYQILNADRPEDLEELTDQDIIGFSVQSRNNIISKVLVNYRPFTDVITGNDSFKSYATESLFTQRTSENYETLDKTIYLYNDTDAQTIAQRQLFFRSLSQTLVNVDAKLNLADKGLNDRMYLNLTRLFKRYGGGDRKKIGIINAISKDGLSVRVSFNDLGNILNRVAAISPDTQNDYALATQSEVVRWGFIVDNDIETPDLTETNLNSNLIG
jgi:hypothetical protein